MAGLCKVTIIGNLGKDPELKYTSSGKPVASFSVAVNRVYSTAEGERKEETEWFRVSAWGRQAEVSSQYLKKGSKVYIEGRLQSRPYETQDGRKGVSLDVSMTEMQILDSKGRTEGGEAGSDDQAGADMDTIPF